MRTVVVFDPANSFRTWLKVKIDTTANAKLFVERVRAEIPSVDAVLIAKKPEKYPDPKSPNRPRGSLWCPYCRAYRRFVAPDPEWYVVCPVCHIGDNNYYIRMANHLFNETEAQERRRLADAMLGDVDDKTLDRREKRRDRAAKRKARRAKQK